MVRRGKQLFLLVTFVFLVVLLSFEVFGARLPTVGGDDDSWGTVLNEFLNVT